MKNFKGKTLRWEWREGCIELTLDHEPANEIGTAMLEELELFVGAFDALVRENPFFRRAEICANCTVKRRQFLKKNA